MTLHTSVQNFCKINSTYWKNKQNKETKEVVLIEGFFAEAGPNYVMRIGMFAKILEEKLNLSPLVLLRYGAVQEPLKKEICSSFNIEHFIGLKEDLQLNFFMRTKAQLLSHIYTRKLMHYLKTGQHKEFRKSSYDGIEFGDLLYDDIIKNNPTKFTVTKVARKHIQSIFTTIFQMDLLQKKYDVKFFITTHAQYVAYGLFLRYCLAKNIASIETTDDTQFYYKAHDKAKYHCYVGKYIKNNLDTIIDNVELLENTRHTLEQRFKGSLEQIDVVLAYKDKEIYTKNTLKQKLGITNNNPCVFIFAHVFADAPTGLSDFQLYPDYYTWLKETIRFCASQTHINWIIKEHPSVAAYNEQGEVAKLIEEYKSANSTIYLCPLNFSTASTKEIAHAIITAQGTVGIEFAFHGIPTILAASPFYAGFGFTHEPKTIEKYQHCLANIQNLTPLSQEEKKMALAVYAGFNLLQNKDNSLIDTEIKALVWGSKGKVGIPQAFELMAQRLENIDPSQSEFWKEAETNITSNYKELC